MRSTFSSLACAAILAVIFVASGRSQQPASRQAAADWPMYRRDHAGTGYSPLSQINPRNVATLKPAWTYRLQTEAAPAAGRGGAGAPNSEATPIVVNGVMYLPALNRVVALVSDTGKELWQHQVTGGAPSRRGVAYWPGDSSTPPRVLFTAGRRLIAVTAETGALASGFGKDGEVDM